jgi:hypothetical protein
MMKQYRHLSAITPYDRNDEPRKQMRGRTEKANMKTKERLKKLRDECWDWDLIVASFTTPTGMSKRDAEISILRLVDAGLVRIEPRPIGPTAFVLTIPKGIPKEVLAHVEE